MTQWRAMAAVTVVGCLSFAGQTAGHPGHESDEQADSNATAPGAPRVSIEVRDGYRYITSNGRPDHDTGHFPNRNNPNRIGPQNYRFRVPVSPTANDQPTPVRGRLFGVAVNGIVFDPGTAEFWNDDPTSGWRMEAIGGPRDLGRDANNAHVQPTGAYHHHAVPTGLIEKLAGKDAQRPALIGWAADGFPIYGPWGYADAKDPKSAPKNLRSCYRVREGQRPDGPGG